MSQRENMPDKEAFIRQKARENQSDPQGEKVLWSRHAIGKLVTEGLTRQAVEQALTTCELIEDYPSLTRPLPDCLVLGWMEEQEPIHAVVAIDAPQDRIFVVTFYRPDPRRWENDYRTRKR